MHVGGCVCGCVYVGGWMCVCVCVTLYLIWYLSFCCTFWLSLIYVFLFLCFQLIFFWVLRFFWFLVYSFLSTAQKTATTNCYIVRQVTVQSYCCLQTEWCNVSQHFSSSLGYSSAYRYCLHGLPQSLQLVAGKGTWNKLEYFYFLLHISYLSFMLLDVTLSLS